MFRTNTPVTADGFLDREGEIKHLSELIARLLDGNPAWLAILGYRKIGKTSLLLEVERRIRSPSLIFVVLDTFEEVPLSRRIYRRYALRLLDGIFSAELGVSLEVLATQPAEFRRVLLLSKRFLALPPALRAKILELSERKIDVDFVREVLQLPEQLAAALDLKILVAWDEFQELTSLSSDGEIKDPFPLMRSIWQRQQRVAYVISGSKRGMLTELVTKEHSPFFQHFSIMDLGPFPPDEAVRLLTQGAPPGKAIPLAIARRAVDIIGCHPFYLQLFGEVLTALPAPYDEMSLKLALQELLFSQTGRLSLYFDNVFRSAVGRSSYLASILQTLASGPKRLTDIAQTIGSPTGATVRYLERLGDVVHKLPDGLYSLTDPTLGLWLTWRQPGSSVVPMKVIGDEAEKRVAEYLARTGFDLVYQSRASRGAFDLLATRGAEQLGIQVKRSSLPLRIKRSDWNRMVADAQKLGWRWIMAAVPIEENSSILLLDPNRAKIQKEVRLDESAAIENLLLWLDKPVRKLKKRSK